MKKLWNIILLVAFGIIISIKGLISTIYWLIWGIRNKDVDNAQAKYENDIDAFSEKLIKVFTRFEA